MLSGMDVDLPQEILFLQNPNAVANKKGDSLFVVAASEGSVDLIQPWLRNQPEDVHGPLEPVTQENITRGLHAAIRAGHLAVVLLILPFVSTINDECSSKKDSALTLAANIRHKEMVKAILMQRLHVYIEGQRSQVRPHPSGLFTQKPESVPVRNLEIEAAEALIKILNNQASYHLVVIRYATVRDCELAVLLAQIHRYYLNLANVPPVNEVTPLIHQEKTVTGCCDVVRCAVM